MMTVGRFAWILLGAALLAGWLSTRGIQHAIDLTPDAIKRGAGKTFYVPLPAESARADTNETPQRSPLRVFEDERELGPAHAMHADIAALGMGRYSHYGDSLYFSTSDDSDASTNGHRYRAVRVWKLDRKVPLGLLLAAVAAAMIAILRGRRKAAASVGAQLRRVASFLNAGPQRLRVTSGLALAAASTSMLLAWGGVPMQQRIDPTKIALADGKMFTYPLEHLRSFADENEAPTRSTLILLENGVRIGPSHAMHADIIKEGGGRYAHFDKHLYFSSPDNSDVRTNGRTYSISYDARPGVAVVLGLWLLATLLVVALARAEAGGSVVDITPASLAAAFEHAGGRWILGIAGTVIGIQLCVLLLGAAEDAFLQFDYVRRGVRVVVTVVLGLCAGAALFAAAHARHMSRMSVAGAAIYVLVLGGCLSFRPVAFTSLVAGGALIAWASTRVQPGRLQTWAVDFGVGMRAALLPATARRQVWLVCAAAAALTLVNVVPEVVGFWDLSGWMDSRAYDEMAHDIARGVAPWGSSQYPPMFQYFMAMLYWTFGHFFFVQQIANVLLACLTPILMCWAAWYLFRSRAALIGIGLFVAYWEPLHHAAWYTQIENLYVPVFALSLLTAARYLAFGRRSDLVMLALAAAFTFATRQQSAFYVMALALCVLVVKGVPLRQRAGHLALFGLIFVGIGMLPWSARNAHVEGRFSPSSAQSVSLMAVLNDPRIPFHAIRYWEKSAEVRAEWDARYPDVKERQAAMQAYFRQRLLQNTDYFVAAAPWRLAAFYGVLPGAYVADDWKPDKPVGFREHWLPQLEATFLLWMPVALSLLAVVWRWRSLTTWLFVALIGGNILVGLLVGSAEARICFPVLLLHGLLATALFRQWVPPIAGQAIATQPRATRWPWRSTVGVAAVAATAVVLHLLLGSHHLYRPLPDVRWTLRRDVKIDPTLPLVSQDKGRLLVDGQPVDALQPGTRYRGNFLVSAWMFPPRFVKGLPALDPALSRPESVQYFYAFLVAANAKDAPRPDTNVALALRYDAAEVPAALVEHQIVMVEFIHERTINQQWAGVATQFGRVERALSVSPAGQDR